MARQSLSPMKNLDYNVLSSEMNEAEKVGRKRKNAPMTHLKYLRKKNGYTLEMLSEITNISISYLSRLESGSRRLNTDLIKRLSHAFSCDPAELLQEVSHDSRVVTSIEFNRKKRNDLMMRDNGIPLYCIAADEKDPSKLTIKIGAIVEWRHRPTELEGRAEVFAIKADGYFKPHFSESSILYLEASKNLPPESTVVILDRGEILIKKIWSVTPTTLELCNINEIDSLKAGNISKNQLLEINRESLDATYKVVGYSDFDLA